MNEERKTFMSDEDIEDLLSPKCDFHASPGFMERVMVEAQAVSKRRRLRRIFLAASTAAAAVTALVIMTVIFHHDKETHPEVANVTASLETPALPDTLHKIISSELIAESTPANIKISAVHQMNTTKSAVTQEPSLILSVKEELSDETKPLVVTEGAMPMTVQEKTLDPDEVRTGLIETRRNAEIAFIEQMRDEIEANQAYIAQLMNEENVYK